MVKSVQAIFLYFLVSVYSIAIFSTRFDGILRGVPAFHTIATLAVVAAAIGMVIVYLRRPSSPFSFLWILALASTAHCALHGADAPLPSVPPLAIIVMIASGLAGKNHSWIIAFCIFTLGETARTIVLQFFNRVPLTAATVIDETLLDPLRYFYLLLAGLLPALLSASYRLEHPLSKASQSPQTAGQEQLLGQPPASVIIKTKAFTVHLADYSSYIDKEEIDDLLSSVVYFMSRNFRCFSSLGFIFDPKRQAFVLNSFQSKSINIIKDVTIPLGKGIIGRIGTEKRSFMTGDLRVYNSELLYYGSDEQVNSILAVPIISEQNELLGSLALDSNDRQAFRDQDKETLKRFSHLAAALITTARMRSFQERSARMFQTFYQASHQFTTALKAEGVFEVLFSVIPTVVPCTRQMGIIFDEERQVGTILCMNSTNGELAPGFTFPINAGLYSFAFQKRKSVVIGDFQQCCDRYYPFVPEEPCNPSIRSPMTNSAAADSFPSKAMSRMPFRRISNRCSPRSWKMPRSLSSARYSINAWNGSRPSTDSPNSTTTAIFRNCSAARSSDRAAINVRFRFLSWISTISRNSMIPTVIRWAIWCSRRSPCVSENQSASTTYRPVTEARSS